MREHILNAKTLQAYLDGWVSEPAFAPCLECGKQFINVINGMKQKVCHACQSGVES